MKRQFYMGQEFLFTTFKWGKWYAFFKDLDGTHYMVPLDENGEPVFK